MREEERPTLRLKYGITQEDERPYAMPEEHDYEILAKIKALEATPLSEADHEVVSLIRSQLLDEWRQPLLAKLNQLLQAYES